MEQPTTPRKDAAVRIPLSQLGLEENTSPILSRIDSEAPSSSLEGLASSTAEVQTSSKDSAIFRAIKDFLKKEGE